MQITKIFAAATWKDALGEVVLIVIGVTIALAANSWYEDRQERRDEVLVLRQLQQALKIDVEELESRFTTVKKLERDIIGLLEHMESDSPYSPELAGNIRSVRRWVGVRSNTAPYEALKSRGFDLVSDDRLRLKLIFYYENQFPSLYESYINGRERNYPVIGWLLTEIH